MVSVLASLLTENLHDELKGFLLLYHIIPHPLDVAWWRRLIVATCAVSPCAQHYVGVC